MSTNNAIHCIFAIHNVYFDHYADHSHQSNFGFHINHNVDFVWSTIVGMCVCDEPLRSGLLSKTDIAYMRPNKLIWQTKFKTTQMNVHIFQNRLF